jgi:nitroimidazol reductase NimA-like FMN-containing flavoprotein (pyridoxamine 5'-phosphate oxidase superfamily)
MAGRRDDGAELKKLTLRKSKRRTKKVPRRQIARLLESQRFAILSTQGKAQPYASIISFVTSRDLKYFFFATPKATRKYHLLKRSGKVALQADNRAGRPKRFTDIESVTATGTAREIRSAVECRRVAARLVGRHPYLKDFCGLPDCAMFRVRVGRYFHVCRFQKVSQWTPGGRG